MREPCFDNLLKILNRQKPDRPTLFEFYLNKALYEQLAGFPTQEGKTEFSDGKLLIQAFRAAGYDYASIVGSDFAFSAGEIEEKSSRSLNEGALIEDRESFERYPWPDPDAFDYSRLTDCEKELPPGMKMMVWGNGGVLENVVKLVGYENLCYLLADDENLVQEIFDAVGSRFARFYEICAAYPAVGVVMSNDDWGFNTQTMISPAQLRRFVFPWHKKIVEAAHKNGKPAILHSCGNLDAVMEDIITDMLYDGKHSYEDKILPAEEAYRRYGGRIAVLGGIDIDFVCRKTPAEIKDRAAKLLALTEKGGYGLGTGNSIPSYVPVENYFAMISAATGEEYSK